MTRQSDDFESLELLSRDREYSEVQGQNSQLHTSSIALFDGPLERLHSLRKLRGSINSWPYMLIGVFLFFILDIVAFICIGKLLLDAKRSISDLDNLDFRDPYVGLDKLYGSHRVNSSHYNSVINEPRFSAQVSPEQANEVFPIDSHRWLSDFGLLSPPDRRFQVSSKKQVRQTTSQSFQ